jgi:hypothetical protein
MVEVRFEMVREGSVTREHVTNLTKYEADESEMYEMM